MFTRAPRPVILAAACAVGAVAVVVIGWRRRRALRSGQYTVHDGGVERSVEDRRRYRLVQLSGGLRALVVSDPQAEKRATAAMCVDRAGARTAPVSLVGLAHYLEHMLFLGSTKYPEESYYKKQVALHNGRCNASTAPEDTVFFFEVDASGFGTVLDVFSQFFVGSPLMDESAAEREVQAVTAEDSRNRVNDDRRRRMVLQNSVAGRTHGAHTWSKFGTGNVTTLDAKAAEKAGVAVRPALLAYRSKFYRTDKMSLVLVSAASLDELEALATSMFGKAGTSNGAGGGATEASAGTIDPAEQAAAKSLIDTAAAGAAASEPDHPWADAETRGDAKRWPFELRIVPVKERRNVTVMWPLPVALSQHRHPRSPASAFLTHLLGHEGEGSLFACLQAESLATGVSSGTEAGSDMAMLSVVVNLTPLGEEKLSLVLQRIFEYVATIAAGIGGAEAEASWAELAHTCTLNFRYAERGDATAEATSWAKRMHHYGGELVLSGGRVLGSFPAARVAACLETMTPDHFILIRESKSLDQLAASVDDDDESDSVSVVAPPPPLPPGAQRLVETYYGVNYERRPIDPALRTLLAASRRGERVPAADGSAPPSLHLPEPNCFLADDFGMLAGGGRGESAPPPPEKLPPPSHGGRLVHWHATETSFARPKAHVVLLMACDATALKQSSLMQLWVQILDQRLAVSLYPAHLAGLRWSISLRDSGIVLSVSGFSQKLPTLVATLVEQLLKWDEAYEALFEA